MRHKVFCTAAKYVKDHPQTNNIPSNLYNHVKKIIDILNITSEKEKKRRNTAVSYLSQLSYCNIEHVVLGKYCNDTCLVLVVKHFSQFYI